jgi:hypothetical protein
MTGRNDTGLATANDAGMAHSVASSPGLTRLLGGGMARCRSTRCRQPFWASGTRAYCDACLVDGEDRRDRARRRHQRRRMGITFGGSSEAAAW